MLHKRRTRKKRTFREERWWRAVRGIEGMGRGEGNRVNEGKNEWCLWREGCVGEVYERRTEVTKIEYRQQDDASAAGKWKR